MEFNEMEHDFTPIGIACICNECEEIFVIPFDEMEEVSETCADCEFCYDEDCCEDCELNEISHQENFNEIVAQDIIDITKMIKYLIDDAFEDYQIDDFIKLTECYRSFTEE